MSLFPAKIKKSLAVVLPLTFGLGIMALAFLFGNEIGVFQGFPKGYDAYGHLSLSRIFRDSFPYLYWNPYWDSGTTLLVRSYPPMTYLLAAFLSRLFTWPLAEVLINLSIGSVLLLALGIYAIVYRLTRRTLPAVLAGLLLLSSPAFWAPLLEGGLYPRLLAAVPLVWSWYFVWQYLRRDDRLWGGRYYFLTVLTIFFGITLHQLTSAWVLLTVVLLIFVGTKDRFTIFKRVTLLFAPAGLMAAFYYLPMLVVLGRNPPSWGRFPGQPAYQAVTLVGLFRSENTLATVPIILVPLAVISVLLRFGRKPDEDGRITLKFARVMLIGAVISLLYAMGFFMGYVHGVYPHHFLFYFIILTTLFTALSYGLIHKKSSFDQMLLVAVCAVVVISWLKQVPVLKKQVVDYSSLHAKAFQSIQVDFNENYRFGNADEVIAGWFNSEYLLPQTRDYYPFGPLHPDWQYYFEEEVWKKEDNPGMTAFLLDWYGVRDLYARGESAIQSGNRGKFSEAAFTVVDDSLYRFNQGGPILSVTNAEVVAVVAREKAFDQLVKGIGHKNLDSRMVVPFWVGEKVKDLEKISDLQVDRVILSDFEGGLSREAVSLLKKFVESGGQLVIEQNYLNYDLGYLPDPWPVGRVIGDEIDLGRDRLPNGVALPWSEQRSDDLDLGEGYWLIETASEVKDWGEVVLAVKDRPVLVSGRYGEGQVIWSGLGLPELWAQNWSSEGLAVFWTDLIVGLNRQPVSVPDFAADFINNHQREVKVKAPAKGLLWKESYYPRWQAELVDQPGADLRIFPAGPMMMYVPLPVVDFPAEVILQYRLSWLEISGLIVSALAWLGYLGAAGYWGIRKVIE